MPDPTVPRPAGLDALLDHVAANLPDDATESAAALAPLAAKIREHKAAHDAEVRAAGRRDGLREGAAAIQAVIDADRAKFPARSNDRTGLGGARQIVLSLIDQDVPPAPPAADPWQTILRLTAWLDSHNGRSGDETALRLLKVTEEAGEVAQAWIGMTGQNPRKGITHTAADVADELCDVITAAMVALATITTDPRGRFDRKIEQIAALRLDDQQAAVPDRR